MKPRHLIPAICCIFVLAYPLSMGPAYRMQLRSNSPKVFQMNRIYAPVIWIGNTFPPLGELFEAYLRLWA